MSPPDRSDIQILARHSNWAEADIEDTLNREIYAHRPEWLTFLRWLLLALGAGSLVCGLVFFFAYNWEDLPKFVKIGGVASLLVGTTLFGVFSKAQTTVGYISLTVATILIGVLFAVLGQIYQTGADSYDLFLVWTLFALPWLVTVHFAPLWLVGVILVNLTFSLYSQQVGIELAYVQTSTILFLLNCGMWLLIFLTKGREFSWLLKIICFWAAVVATVNLSAWVGIYESPGILLLAIATAALAYLGWTYYGLKHRQLFYPAVTGGSTIITLAFLLLRMSDYEVGVFFVTGILILAGMTVLANYLNKLSKRWRSR